MCHISIQENIEISEEAIFTKYSNLKTYFKNCIKVLYGKENVEVDKNLDNGGLILRAFQDADIAIRYPGAFCVCEGIDIS